MAWKTLTYRITGDAPLIMHNGALANPLSAASKALKQVTSKKKKTDADFERMAEIEFKAGLYMDEDSGPSFLARTSRPRSTTRPRSPKRARSPSQPVSCPNTPSFCTTARVTRTGCGRKSGFATASA
jgi:hypothetical protein